MIRDHVYWLVLLRNNKWEITDSVLTSSLLLKDKSIFCLCVYPNKRCPHPTQVGFWGLWGPGSLATWLAPSSGGGKRHRCRLHPGGPFTLLILYSIFLLYSTLYTFLCSGGSPLPFLILYSIFLFLIPPFTHLSFRSDESITSRWKRPWFRNEPSYKRHKVVFVFKVL